MQIIYFLMTGSVAGVLSGMFGIGGGIILVPALVFFFGMPQSAATGTSLVALLLPVGILAVWEYYKEGKIGVENIRIGLLLALGVFLGAYLGSKIATRLPDHLLRKSFAIFLTGVALKMWLHKS